MAAQKRKGKKSRVPKVSLAKLSNKRLNRLAKQGRLKKATGKKKLVALLQRRTNHPDVDREQSPEDIPLEEADYEYFAQPGRNFDFLSEMAFSEKTKPKKRKHDDADFENVEGLYEKRLKPTSAESNVEVKALLPFKSKEKGIIHRTIEVERKPEDEGKPEDSGAVDVVDVPEVPLTVMEEVIQEELKLKETKKQMKKLASGLFANPQENVKNLKELLFFIDNKETEFPLAVRKSAIKSLTSIYKDILPEYRIRVLTDTEKKQSMKKEKKQLYAYEAALVNSYRGFLESLQFLAIGKRPKDKKKKEENGGKAKKQKVHQVNKSLRRLSIKSLCELLLAHPHFNYRTEVISAVLRFIVNGDPELSDMVCDAVRRLFGQDKSGEVSLEVVRLIGRIIKVKNYKVKPKVLNTFLSLKIKQVERHGDQEKQQKMTKDEKMKKFSRRERKRQKAMEHLEKELREAAAEQDVKQKVKLHTQIINTVFLTYFRILKNLDDGAGLLASVLEGLAKFAHLINVSYFNVLFPMMTELVTGGELTNRCSLNCIQTALTLLMGLGEALNVDPVKFYSHLYKVILHLHAGNSAEDLPIALRCLDILINKRRRLVSEQRILAFLKRLATVTLQMSADGALALLGIIRKIFSEFPKSDVLLSNDTIGCGVFMPELDEPDYCNASNTSLFELHLLRKSYHPGVRNFANSLLKRPVNQ